MKRIIVIVATVLIVGGLIFGGCTTPSQPSEPGPTPSQPPEQGPTEILLGDVEPVTGSEAANYVSEDFSIKKAVEDINKQGGVFVKKYNKKLPVRVILVDEESDGNKSASLATELILKDKVHALITGLIPAFLVEQESVVAERHQIPLIAGYGPLEAWQPGRMAATPPWQYTWGYGFGFVTAPPTGDFNAGDNGYVLAPTVIGLMNKYADKTNKKVGLCCSNDPDGNAFYSVFPDGLQKEGWQVTGLDKRVGIFTPGTTDHSVNIMEWKKNDTQVLLVSAAGPDGGVLLRQCSSLGYKPKLIIMSRGALYYQDIIAWGGDIPSGVVGEMLWSPEFPPESFHGIGDTTPQSIWAEYSSKPGTAMHPGLGWGYFLVQVMADAISRAGTLDGPSINKAIGETDMVTLCGRAVFAKESHHCFIPLALGQWQKNDKPSKYDAKVAFSLSKDIKVNTEPIFPRP